MTTGKSTKTSKSKKPQKWQEQEEWPLENSPSSITWLLFDATRARKIEAVDFLICKGADIHAIDADVGYMDHVCYGTPLHYAVWHNHIEIARLLIARGADVDAIGTGIDDGHKCLHFAAHHGNIEIVRLLVENGASVDSRDDIGNTPLHEAAEYGHLEVVRFLVSIGADVKCRNLHNETAFDCANKRAHTMTLAGYLGSITR